MKRSKAIWALWTLTIAVAAIGCRNRASKDAPSATAPKESKPAVEVKSSASATAAAEEKDAPSAEKEAKNPAATKRKAKALAAGGNHTCAVKNGEVYCWGENGFGELGGGTVGENATRPIKVEGLRDVVALASGRFHNCALLENGTVSCWGRNDAGQLGNGKKDWQITSPTRVEGLRDVIMLAAGVAHTCAVMSDGTAACWGDNESGRLGNGSSGSHAKEPVVVPNLRDVVEIAAGLEHTCARHADGTVSCWGGNQFGQLGIGTSGNDAGKLVPTPVPGLSRVVEIAAGLNHTCARLENGDVACWGYDYSGQLGSGVAGKTTGTPKPTVIRHLHHVIELAAGEAHTCARMADDDVLCWGANFSGQIGDGSEDALPKPYPTYVLQVYDALELAAGDNHSCARFQTHVSCWGENESGQLGDGTTESNAHAGRTEF